MSRQNVELVRDAYARLAAQGELLREGRVDELDLSAVIDDKVVWEEPVELPGAAVFHGRDGVREALREAAAIYDDLSAEPEELIDAGDHVVVRQRVRGRGRKSGIPLDALTWQVFTVERGKIVARRVFMDRETALAAAGAAS